MRKNKFSKNKKLKFLILPFFSIFIFSCGILNKNEKIIFYEKEKNSCEFICSKKIYESEKPKLEKINFEYDKKSGRYYLSEEEFKKLKINEIKQKYWEKKLIEVIKNCVCGGKIKN